LKTAFWNRVTAVMGGTFDPPHLGHEEAVEGLFEYPGVSRVLILPAATPPQKLSQASTNARIKMCDIAFGPESRLGKHLPVRIDWREIERAERCPGRPSYSYDTLLELNRDYSDLAFVIGVDQLEKLSSWYRFPELLGLSHWIVLERKPDGHDRAQAVLRDWVASGLAQKLTDWEWGIQRDKSRLIIVPTEARQISSTQIREEIGRTGQPPEGYLSSELISYLKLHRIYGMRSLKS